METNKKGGALDFVGALFNSLIYANSKMAMETAFTNRKQNTDGTSEEDFDLTVRGIKRHLKIAFWLIPVLLLFSLVPWWFSSWLSLFALVFSIWMLFAATLNIGMTPASISYVVRLVAEFSDKVRGKVPAKFLDKDSEKYKDSLPGAEDFLKWFRAVVLSEVILALYLRLIAQFGNVDYGVLPIVLISVIVLTTAIANGGKPRAAVTISKLVIIISTIYFFLVPAKNILFGVRDVGFNKDHHSFFSPKSERVVKIDTEEFVQGKVALPDSLMNFSELKSTFEYASQRLHNSDEEGDVVQRILDTCQGCDVKSHRELTGYIDSVRVASKSRGQKETPVVTVSRPIRRVSATSVANAMDRDAYIREIAMTTSIARLQEIALYDKSLDLEIITRMEELNAPSNAIRGLDALRGRCRFDEIRGRSLIMKIEVGRNEFAEPVFINGKASRSCFSVEPTRYDFRINFNTQRIRLDYVGDVILNNVNVLEIRLNKNNVEGLDTVTMYWKIGY